MVVLNLIVAKETDLIAALAWPEVLVSHVHILHAEWAACQGRASDLMSDGNAGWTRIAMQERWWPVVPLCWARARGKTHNHHRPSPPQQEAGVASLPAYTQGSTLEVQIKQRTTKEQAKKKDI